MRLAVRSTAVAICRVAINPTSSGGVTTLGQSPAVHPNADQQVIVVHHAAAIPPALKPVKPSQLAAAERAKAHALNYRPPTGAYSAATFNGYGSGHPVGVQAPKSPSANPDNGFDWGDAAIGAAAGLTLTLLIGGGAMAISRRRSPRGDSANVATT
jgi:hypothetical protein